MIMKELLTKDVINRINTIYIKHLHKCILDLVGDKTPSELQAITGCCNNRCREIIMLNDIIKMYT